MLLLSSSHHRHLALSLSLSLSLSLHHYRHTQKSKTHARGPLRKKEEREKSFGARNARARSVARVPAASLLGYKSDIKICYFDNP